MTNIAQIRPIQAPYYVGQGFMVASGRCKWISAIAPETGNKMMLTGPHAFKPIAWQIRTIDDNGVIGESDEYAIADAMAAGCAIEDCADVALLVEQSAANMAKRRADMQAQAAADSAARVIARQEVTRYAPALGLTISRHIHTKRGFDMWICEMSERVERAEYMRLLDLAKQSGGWYSRAWQGTPAGFAFKSEAAAIAFGGDSPLEQAAPSLQTENRNPVIAAKVTPAPAAKPNGDKLRAMAAGMQAAIDHKMADRLSNTPKRQREAGNARQDGRDLQRAQSIMRALADHHDAGTGPAILATVTTKAAIVALAQEGVDHSRGGYYSCGEPTGKPRSFLKGAELAQAEAAWAMLTAPVDKAAHNREVTRQKIEALRFAKIPGYFPTPTPLVEQMLDAAELAPGSHVLEPSAGSGAIADVLREAGHTVACIERQHSLAEILELKGFAPAREDFLETLAPPVADRFDAVLMNPPFEAGQDLAHVRHAFNFVKAGGRLVAIMGAGVTFRTDSKYSAFRSWAEDLGGEFVDIPAGAFKESGTGVASVMLTLCK